MGTLVPVSPVPIDELERRSAALIASVRSRRCTPCSNGRSTLRPNRAPPSSSCRRPCATTTPTPRLLEHSLIVAEVAGAVAERFDTVNRDLTVAGACCTTSARCARTRPTHGSGFTDAGRLHGEIVIGHDIVRGLIDEIPASGRDGPSCATSHLAPRRAREGSPSCRPRAKRHRALLRRHDARLAAIDEIAGRTAATRAGRAGSTCSTASRTCPRRSTRAGRCAADPRRSTRAGRCAGRHDCRAVSRQATAVPATTSRRRRRSRRADRRRSSDAVTVRIVFA